MKALYIGGHNYRKKAGFKWKLYMFLFFFFALTGTVLKITAPTIAEKWINKMGSKATGFAFSIRDVQFSFGKGQVTLSDVKVFNPTTNNELLEAPTLTLKMSVPDFLLSQDKKVKVEADKVDVYLSKDFSSEIERMKSVQGKNKDYYLNVIEGKIGNLNIIEEKDDQSRKVLELSDMNIKVKDVSLLSINKKTEFTVSSKVADGGKLDLTGKTTNENGHTPWSINGSLKKVPSDIFNKMAGNKLPFAFNEPTLNAEISARSENGKISGEISPDIKRLNLIEERPGIPTQSIARALTDELTFTLPFTLKDDLELKYTETYTKLKNYRKDPVISQNTEPAKAPVTQNAVKPKKSFSFWTF